MAREVEVLGGIRESPKRPFVGIIGGAKVSDKLGVVKALLGVVDELLIGGGMCFTFLAARGASVGASLLEEDMVEACAGLLESGAPIRLPIDLTALGPGGRIGDPSTGGEVRQAGTSLPDGWMGLDIGPGSAVEFCDVIAEARTVLWNGPMGVFEDPRFAAGTRTVAEAVADCTRVYATTARARDLTKRVLTPEAAMIDAARRIAGGEKVAVLFGPERAGLENDDIALASAIVSVPVNPDFASLNLAQCALLTAYEWRRQQGTVPKRIDYAGTEPARAIEVQKLGDHFESRLDEAGFFFPETKAQGMKINLRNMWSRLPLTRADVQIFHGMLRQIVRWKERGE